MNKREYMKSMNRKEKIDYIWYYYKVHIILSIIAVILIGSFITQSMNKKNYVFNFSIIGTSVDTQKLNDMEKEADKLLIGETDGKNQVLFDFLIESKNSNGELELQAAMQEKFSVKTAAGEINVAALDKRLFDNIALQGGFIKINDLKGLELNNTATVKAKNDKGAEDVYGIDLSGNKKMKSIGYDTDGKVLCVLTNAKNVDMSVKFINWLIK